MVRMSNVWDRTAEFLSENISAILPVALVAFFIPASIEGNFTAVREGAGPGLGLALAIVQILFAVLSLWGSLTITVMALDDASRQGAAGIALRRLPAMLLVFAAMFVAILVLAAPIGVMLARSGYDFTAMETGSNLNMDPSTALWISAYGLVLMIVLFWLAARLIVTTGVVAAEKRALGAIPRSWGLTRGHALRIIGVLILYAVVAWVAYMAAAAVFGTAFALVADSEGEGITLAGVLTAIVTAAVQTAFSVLGAAFTAKLYVALANHAEQRAA